MGFTVFSQVLRLNDSGIASVPCRSAPIRRLT